RTLPTSVRRPRRSEPAQPRTLGPGRRPSAWTSSKPPCRCKGSTTALTAHQPEVSPLGRDEMRSHGRRHLARAPTDRPTPLPGLLRDHRNPWSPLTPPNAVGGNLVARPQRRLHCARPPCTLLLHAGWKLVLTAAAPAPARPGPDRPPSDAYAAITGPFDRRVGLLGRSVGTWARGRGGDGHGISFRPGREAKPPVGARLEPSSSLCIDKEASMTSMRLVFALALASSAVLVPTAGAAERKSGACDCGHGIPETS